MLKGMNMLKGHKYTERGLIYWKGGDYAERG